ncbi:MAG: DUF1385 domain-containing protein [Eubacteriales bacterium]
MRVCNIGGQGVLEGVMMRSTHTSALAVRKASGEIVLKKTPFVSKTKTNKFYKLPIIRGVVSFVEMLKMGVGTISDSATMYDETVENEQPSKFEAFLAQKLKLNPMDVMMFFAVLMAIGFSVLLFFIVPNVITKYVSTHVASTFLKNLIEGGIRILIFILYIVSITFIKDIKRLFMYHGAEHRVINCYEHEKELTVENAQGFTTLNPRCGTSFMLIVMVVAVIVFSFFGWSEQWYYRVGLRLALLPLVAGISYEVLKLLAKSENIFVKILRAPGMSLQYLTTKPPTDDMTEVSMLAFRAAEGVFNDEELEAMRVEFSHGAVKTETEESIPAGELQDA